MRGFALAAALVAAALVPGERLGVAVPAVAALMLLAAREAARVSLLRLVFGALAFVLAAQAAVLDAGWVVWLDISAAWVLACLAAAGPNLVAIAAPIRALPLLPAVRPKPSSRWIPALRGSALGAVALLPFALLFLSADAAFAGFAGDLPLPSPTSLPARVGTLVLILTAALGLGLAARVRSESWELPTSRRLAAVEWVIPLALLNTLFLIFVGVQFAVLFGGHDRVLETTGLTYAEYARSGFWQLLVVTALTCVVTATAWRFAEVNTRRDGIVLRFLLGALLCLTLVPPLGDPRLRLYEDAFGLTRLRLLAESFALWLGALLLLVGASGALASVRARAISAAVILTAAGLIAFSLANPDGRIARADIDRWKATGRLDHDYLAGLSADAVPALVELPLPERRLTTMVLRDKLGPSDPWSSANLSRTRARRLLYESRSARKLRSRSEFETTKTLEKAIAPPAISRFEGAPRSRHGDCRNVPSEGPEEVGLDRRERPPGEANRVRRRAKVAGDEREVARLDRDIGSGSDRESEICLRECRCVVDTVADHRDHATFSLQTLDDVGLLRPAAPPRALRKSRLPPRPLGRSARCRP